MVASGVPELMVAVGQIIGYVEMDEYVIDTISILHTRQEWDKGTRAEENKQVELRVIVRYTEVQ